MVDLRSAAYYYENIAEDNEDDMRRSALQDTAAQLHKIISQIEAELQCWPRTFIALPIHANILIDIDTTMAQCKIEAEEVLNCPGLQDYKVGLLRTLHTLLTEYPHSTNFVPSLCMTGFTVAIICTRM